MTELVRAEHLEVSYRRTRVLTQVDLTLSVGDEVAVTGRSGSGKTTLLLALAGLLPAATVTWPGLSTRALDRRHRIGVVFQAPSLVPELTALENVVLPLRLRGSGRTTAGEAARAALADVGLADAADALPSELSGGQQQRVALARTLTTDPLLLLADEPTGALDATTGAQMMTVLRARVRHLGGALLVATHDETVAALMPVRLELRDGRLSGSGPPADPALPEVSR
jgi:putative ABC transport system ATP-binding protein